MVTAFSRGGGGCASFRSASRTRDFGTLVSIGGRESPKARGLVQIRGDAMAEAMAEKRPCTLRLYAPWSGSEAEKGIELSFKIATPATPAPAPSPFKEPKTSRSEGG